MMETPKLQLVAEYGQLTRPQGSPPKPATPVTLAYPYARAYRPYMLADKHEEIVHTLQLIVWRDGHACDVWGIPYMGMTVWDLTGSGLVFSCYGYEVTIQATGLRDDWRFREALGKHRIKSICQWHAPVHNRPSAQVPCITRIIRTEDA